VAEKNLTGEYADREEPIELELRTVGKRLCLVTRDGKRPVKNALVMSADGMKYDGLGLTVEIILDRP